jgi:hypothetical protein
MTESDILRRVRALLDKAESTTFEAERDAYVEKAQALMLKHAIDEAMVANAQTGKRELPTKKYFMYTEGKGYAQAKIDLLASVCRNNRVRVVFHTKSQSSSDKRRFATMVGFTDDMEFCEMLYTSLWLQLTAEGIRAHEQAPEEFNEKYWDYRKPHRKSFLSAFADGFIAKVSGRMREATKTATESQGSRALVLVDRKAEVDTTYAQLFPSTGKLGRSSNKGSADAYMAGSAAGARANLGKSSLGNSRPAIGNR